MSKAREKLSSHQLERPGSYLQKILQGLIGLGPTGIAIRLGRKEILFEVDPSPLDLTSKLPPALLNPLQHDARLKDLAVGLNSAFGQGITAIQVVSYQGLDGQLLEIGDSLAEESFRGVRPVNRTYIRLTRERPVNLTRWFLGPVNLPAEHHALSQGFVYCPIPVKLDGRSLANPTLGSAREEKYTTFGQPNFHLAERFVHDPDLEAHDSVGFERPDQRRPCLIVDAGKKKRPWNAGYRRTEHGLKTTAAVFVLSKNRPKATHGKAMLALRYDLLGEETFIVFVLRGLLTEVVKVDLGCPGVTAVCSAAGLNTDLSLFRLARDDAFEERISWLREQVKAIVEEFHKAHETGRVLPYADDQLNAHLTRLPQRSWSPTRDPASGSSPPP
jgi:hypothetical protein